MGPICLAPHTAPHTAAPRHLRGPATPPLHRNAPVATSLVGAQTLRTATLLQSETPTRLSRLPPQFPCRSPCRSPLKSRSRQQPIPQISQIPVQTTDRCRYRNQPKDLSPYRSTHFTTVITVHSKRFCGMMAPRSLNPDSSPPAFSGRQHAGSSHSGFRFLTPRISPMNQQGQTSGVWHASKRPAPMQRKGRFQHSRTFQRTASEPKARSQLQRMNRRHRRNL